VNDARFQFVDRLEERHVEQLHALYQGEWWSAGRTLDDARRVVAGSQRVFGVCDEEGQLVAFARVVTDGVLKALIFDVIVAPALRHAGLGRTLIRRIVDDPQLRTVRHIELYCKEELIPYYEQFGFRAHVPDVHFMRRA
jgi:predicted GNAT family N-acyltransferase